MLVVVTVILQVVEEAVAVLPCLAWAAGEVVVVAFWRISSDSLRMLTLSDSWVGYRSVELMRVGRRLGR